MLPPSESGNVERTVPSVSRRSGVVKTSSVGTLTMCEMPSTVVSAPSASDGQEEADA